MFFSVSGYLLYCTVSVVLGQLHTANIIVCFFCFRLFIILHSFCCFWDSYTQLILLYVFSVSGYLLYCTVPVVLEQLHTANIIVCFSVSGYLLYCTVSVVLEQLHTASIF